MILRRGQSKESSVSATHAAVYESYESPEGPLKEDLLGLAALVLGLAGRNRTDSILELQLYRTRRSIQSSTVPKPSQSRGRTLELNGTANADYCMCVTRDPAQAWHVVTPCASAMLLYEAQHFGRARTPLYSTPLRLTRCAPPRQALFAGGRPSVSPTSTRACARCACVVACAASLRRRLAIAFACAAATDASVRAAAGLSVVTEPMAGHEDGFRPRGVCMQERLK